MSRIAEHIGRVLGGRYRLLAPIGTGASAHVFLADDVTLGRQVAVKILHPGLAGDEAFLRRFQLEAQAAAVLTHPNVLRVFDWGEDHDGPFLVLEYLGGGSLRDVLDAGRRLTTAQAAHVGDQAARALAYAHRRGIVHRDVKPANLLFDEEGRLCIADFGLARALAEAAWTEPAGTVLGTARYASPEQAQGQPVDGRSDVYSLGLVLIEAVTGGVPFEADTTIATLMARVGTDVIAPPEMGLLGLAVEQAGLANAEARPDAAALAATLERLCGRLPAPDPLPLHPPGRPSGRRDRHPTQLGGKARRGVTRAARREAVSRHPATAPSLTVARLAGGAAARSELLRSDPDRPHRARARSRVDPVTARPLSSRAASFRPRRGLLIAVVAALLLAGAAAIALVASGALVPSHPVPQLRGLTVAQARARLGPEHLKVTVAGRRYDAAVRSGAIASQSPPARASLAEGSTVTVIVSKGPQPVAVPNLANTDELTAVADLARAGLGHHVTTENSETVPSGTVITWSPSSGLHLPGTVVTLVVSSGPAPRTVPDLTGQPYAAAAAQLSGLGLSPSRQDAFSDTVAAGQVVSTQPGAGGSVPRGAQVTVVVSKGPDLVGVPDVTGQSVAAAAAALQGAGLQAVNVFGPPGGTVFTTNPPPGAQVHRGSGVNLYTR